MAHRIVRIGENRFVINKSNMSHREASRALTGLLDGANVNLFSAGDPAKFDGVLYAQVGPLKSDALDFGPPTYNAFAYICPSNDQMLTHNYNPDDSQRKRVEKGKELTLIKLRGNGRLMISPKRAAVPWDYCENLGKR